MKSQLIAIVAAVLVVGCGRVDIHKAAELGNIEVVKQHIAAGTDVNAKGEYGKTPLIEATMLGQNEIAELLIAKGADVNTKDEEESTPLHYAASQGFAHEEIAELLIDKGAEVNAKDEDGETPLDAANETNHHEPADLLRKHGGKTAEELKAEGK